MAPVVTVYFLALVCLVSCALNLRDSYRAGATRALHEFLHRRVPRIVVSTALAVVAVMALATLFGWMNPLAFGSVLFAVVAVMELTAVIERRRQSTATERNGAVDPRQSS